MFPELVFFALATKQFLSRLSVTFRKIAQFYKLLQNKKKCKNFFYELKNFYVFFYKFKNVGVSTPVLANLKFCLPIWRNFIVK